MHDKTSWTTEQWDAITEKDCNLLVAAAAGAGKTAVLVERIIGKITDARHPVDIDRLLIMTFTNAAAAEMRERIAEAISSVLEKNPASQNMQRQLTLLNKASITTIHSFCLEVIRNNFQRINIDPGFRIADQTEAALLRLDVLHDLFEDQYEIESENQDFFELLECYGGNRDDQALQEMVLNLYTFIQSSPWPETWLIEMTEAFNPPAGIDFGETSWGRVLLQTVVLEVAGLIEMMGQAMDILRPEPGLEKYLPVYLEDLSNLEAILKVCKSIASAKWDAVFRTLQNIEFSRLPTAGKNADRVRQDYVKKIRDDMKDRIKQIREKVVPADSAAILDDMRTMYPLMKCLARLAADFGERYASKKSQKSVVDFNDLEHFCLEILSEYDSQGNLRPSQAAQGYRERFAEILVDEYQDSNLVQEIMIRMISDNGKSNVFMVGDVKQSIYRFRQAKPELFLDKYNSYALEKGYPCRKILLFKNFRSRKEVVDAVNFIFRQIMSVQVGEMDYTDLEALHPGAVFAEHEQETTVVGGETEFHLIQTGGSDAYVIDEDSTGETEGSGAEVADQQEMLDSIQCEARIVAKRIEELMQTDGHGRKFCVFDKASREYRKVEHRDIVILLRTTSNWSNVFIEELALQGIPVFADTGTGFFKTTEVQVMLSLLQIIDNPLQDIPLLSVLRSPVVSFTTDELAELRLSNRKGSLYDALGTLAQGSQSPAAKKAAVFMSDLSRWREISVYTSNDQLLWQLYNETGYYGTVGAMPAGEQRQANLRVLFERAKQFEETSYKGLFNFINFVDKLKSSRGDMGSAKILGENDNVVRIMSIHKSKGLEFPVVILAGCGKRFNLQDMNKSILLHQELGFGPDVVVHRRRLAYPSVPKQAIREKIRAETLAEEMRILYVALTRAREKLIITGSVADIPKALAKWSDCAGMGESKLPAYEMLKGGRYLDWIGPALLRHRGCGSLRENSGNGSEFRGQLIEDPSIWGIRTWKKVDILSSRSAAEHQESDFFAWLDGMDAAAVENDLSKEISRRLGWAYQHAKATKVPAKVSVTELKRRFDAELAEETGAFTDYLPALVKKPMFLEEKKGLSPAEAGTVLHFVMQRLDYQREDLEAQLGEMVAKALLTGQQAQNVDVGKIRRFLQSPLGKRLLDSGSVHREVPFNMEIPCHEIISNNATGGRFPTVASSDQLQARQGDGSRLSHLQKGEGDYPDDTVLLQGVIDCYFEESDGIVLLDYKTDYVPPGRMEMIKERYRLQIIYYSRALELLTGKKVKEKYIYLFQKGEALDY